MEQYTMGDNKKCIFCNIRDNLNESRIIYENDLWVAIWDGYPVSMGHTLLIPKRHCSTYLDLNMAEAATLMGSIKEVVNILKMKYGAKDFNIGVNCGKNAGQTVMHCHIHIIPRYEGDCENPRGGVRGVIPSKQSY